MNSLPSALTTDYDRLVGANDWDGVRLLLAPLLRTGLAEAQYLSCMSSQPGETSEAFHSRHVELVRAASVSGYAPAQFTLGMYHLFGDGVSRDPQRATELFAAASGHGYPPAQYEYGLALLHGVGVPADPVEGLRLIGVAAASGNETAKEFLLGRAE